MKTEIHHGNCTKESRIEEDRFRSQDNSAQGADEVCEP